MYFFQIMKFTIFTGVYSDTLFILQEIINLQQMAFFTCFLSSLFVNFGF
jgi:hypothetical protein